MPNWRFLVVPHYGGAQQRKLTCEMIKGQVEESGLSCNLPMVKYEPGRRGEYYLGLAVVCNLEDADSVECSAREILCNVGVHSAQNQQRFPILDPSTNEQIERWLRGSLECESFTIPMAYEASGAWEAPPSGRLLSELDFSELQPFAPNAAETEQYSRLLYWCSAIGSGGLDRIRQVCQTLGINNDWGGAWSVLRRLVLLGHLEFDGGAALRWSVIPPTLVTSVEDPGRRILVGQRTPTIVRYLSERLHLEERPQANGPPRLLIQGEANEIWYGSGRRVRDAGCASRQLSKLLPTLSDWVRRLPTWDEGDFGRFATEEYDPHADEFRQVPQVSGNSRTGLYRFTFEQPSRRVVTVAFFDDNDGRWICGDYYGLRFLARARCGLFRAVYCRDAYQLVVPATDRWPMPYERALVLARGSLPQRLQAESGLAVFVYEGISPEFAASMCRLLGLEMEGD
jgi:hypothetical protein